MLCRLLCPLLVLGFTLASAACAGGASETGTTDVPDALAEAGADASTDARPDVPAPGDTEAAETTVPPDTAEPEPRVALTYLAPERGTFVSGCDAPVAVAVALAPVEAATLVTLQGQPVTPVDGVVRLDVPPAEGLNVVKAVAMDAGGGKSREHRAFLCGTYAPPDTLVRSAADLYLGRAALAALVSVAADVFDGLDLGAGFTGAPVYENDVLRVDLQRIEHAPGTVFELVPGEGSLDLELDLYGVDGTFTLTIKGSESHAYDARVHAERLSAWATVTLGLDDLGAIQVFLDRISFDFEGLELYLGDEGNDLLAVLPSARDVLVDLLESMLAKTLQDMLPPALQKGLARLSEPFDLTLLGRAFQLRFAPAALEVRPEGVHVALDLALAGLEPDPGYASPGVLWTPGNDAWKKGLTGFRLAVKDDLLNVVFHEAWRAGFLQAAIDQELIDRYKLEIDLVAGFLGGLLERIPDAPGPETPIHLDLHPTFPPVASLDLPVAGGVRLGVGDLALDVWADEWSWLTPLLPLTLTLRAELRVTAEGTTLAPAIDTFEVLLDVASDDPALFAAESYAGPVADQLFGVVGPLLGDLLTEIPVPVPEGLVIQSLSVGSNPENGGTLLIEGEVSKAP